MERGRSPTVGAKELTTSTLPRKSKKREMERGRVPTNFTDLVLERIRVLELHLSMSRPAKLLLKSDQSSHQLASQQTLSQRCLYPIIRQDLISPLSRKSHR
ncbi:unnamed protein product [Ilex paraguariensis]|uniref:Uncharacterized protein n=1 Tax=Ilex paraguariensis TaxID=185542 RepID=A0ABC8SS76_9AQUA